MVLRNRFIRSIFKQCFQKTKQLGTSVPALKIDIGTSSLQGRSKLNEDKLSHDYIAANILYTGIYDGHNGDFVSNFANVNLPLILKKHLQCDSYKLYDNIFSRINDILLKSFDECQELIKETIHSVDDIPRHDMVGSTAVTSILVDNTYLTVANVGDSKAILCRNGESVELSIEHHPDNVDEALRVKEAGGHIDWDSRFKPLVNSRLSMTRSFGNLLLKPKGVISEPSIKNILINEAIDSFLVLCSDGITHAMSDEEIVYVVGQHDKPIDAAEDLTSTAQQYGSTDDCTALVVPLPAWRCVDVKMKVNTASMFRTLTGGRSNG